MVKTTQNHKHNRLKLNHETVRVMNNQDLVMVVGGSTGGGCGTSQGQGGFTSRWTCCEQ
jgi:hypothetical protein